ncbi:MAG: hypothetical protein IJW40_06995 [Clostridia bacterium]|nr:hypothetical protein [Clostridia bacterium]
MLYYVIDSSLQAKRNAAGEDYTPAYIPAMLAFMGVTGEAIVPDAMSTLTERDIVLVAADRPAQLSDCKATVILMGACEENDSSVPARVRRIFGEYMTKGGVPAPLFVPIRSAADVPDEVLAVAKTADGAERPALIRCGKNYEFLFDLPATLWFSGDGVCEMQNDPYFPLGRTPDWRPLPNGVSSAHPYNDLLILEMERILRSLGVPTIYRLPPMEDGDAPDLVLHFSGDDDCTSADFNRKASRVMKEKGFYYHINAMPNGNGQFIFDREVLRELNENGCELGLHLDLTCSPYTAQTVDNQFKLFCETFGIHPCTNVNHCLIQHGSQAEFLRWLQACDIIADNGYLGEFDPKDINAFDLNGFGYGTSFPRYTCDDAAHGNVPLRTMLIPITYYEARLPEKNSDTSKVISYIDAAVANARITQFFFHPHYLTEGNPHFSAALRVLELIKSHTAAHGYRVLPSSTNRIATFWQARAAATVRANDDAVTVSTEVPLLLRLPAAAEQVTLDGAVAPVIQKQVEGENAYLVFVPAGEHLVK